MIKFISWNIDSLNAALTSTSARAELSRTVLDTIKGENADIIAIQETKLPATGMTDKHKEALAFYFPTIRWSGSVPYRQPERATRVPWFYTKSPCRHR